MTVGLIVKRNTNPFWVTMKDIAEQTADDDNVKLLTAAGKSDIDNASQVAALAKMTADGREGHPDHPGRLEGDRAGDREGAPGRRDRDRARHAHRAAVGRRRALSPPNNEQAGELIGRYAKAKAAEHGIKPKIAMLDLAPGITSGELRHHGFLKGFGINDGDPRIVGSVDTLGETGRAEDGLRQLLAKDPDINVVYTVNEPAAFGAAQALKAAGTQQRRRDPRLGRRRLRRGQERRQAGRDRRHRAAVPREHGAAWAWTRWPTPRAAAEAVGLQEHGRRADHRRRRRTASRPRTWRSASATAGAEPSPPLPPHLGGACRRRVTGCRFGVDQGEGPSSPRTDLSPRKDRT